MQEPPPKCLMFVLSGVLLAHPQQQTQQEQEGSSSAATLLDSCNLPHLNRATAQGNLCLLTVRKSSTPGATGSTSCRNSLKAPPQIPN
jgi:hypothetical protein